MNQLSLFDPPDTKPALARRDDPQTSHDAAEKVNKRASWPVVAGFLEVTGPATAEQVVAKARQLGSTYSDSRIRGALSPDEMLGEGLVRKVAKGLTERGNPCAVYELTDKGRQQLLD